MLESDLDHRRAHAVLELIAGALGDDPPVVDHRDPVGELVGLLEVLRGEQERHALAHELAHDGPDRDAAARVEARGRLVEEQDPGLGDEARSEVEPPPHASGVGLDRPIARVGEVEALEQLVGAGGRLAPGQVEQPTEQAQVLAPGQELVDGRELSRQADQLAHLCGLVHDVEAEHLGAPAVGAQQRRQHPDERRLARAVRPEQSEHGALGDLKVDASERHRLAEAPREARRPGSGAHRVGGIEGLTAKGLADALSRSSSVRLASRAGRVGARRPAARGVAGPGARCTGAAQRPSESCWYAIEAKDRRCTGEMPCAAIAARCSGVE